MVCYDNLLTSSISNINHLMGSDGFEFFEEDIRDSESLKMAIEGVHPCNTSSCLGFGSTLHR